jgi:hypothetical protein
LYGAPVSEPKFWKALLATAFFCVPLSLIVRAVFRMSDVTWLITALASTLVTASILHARVVNDWRAADTMNLEVFERRTRVAPNIRIGKKRWP